VRRPRRLRRDSGSALCALRSVAGQHLRQRGRGGLIMSLQTFDGAKFTWRGQTGASEASDLGIQTWPAGFYIRSPRTQELRLFLAAESLYQGQGEDRERVGQRYISPGNGLEAVVYND